MNRSRTSGLTLWVGACSTKGKWDGRILPPFRTPVFVLTHHSRDPWPRQGGTTFTFVTDGIESALEQAKEAADDRDVRIAGGANIIQQFLEAGLVDEVQIHLAPVLLGGGIRLFDRVDPERLALEVARVIDSPRVTHLRYDVKKEKRD
jgi:dihydrofolate reductase